MNKDLRHPPAPISDQTRAAGQPAPGSPATGDFGDFANHMLQLAWIADGEGRIIWFNHRWYEFTGTTPEEMRDGGWRKVHHPDHVESVVAKIERSFQHGEPWEDTFPMRAADGTYRWFLSRAEPFRDERGGITYWFGTCTDVTAQMQAATEVEKERRKLEAVLHSIQDAVIVADAQGRIVFLNPSAMTLVGFLGDTEMHSELESYTNIFEFELLDGTPLPLEQWPLARILRGESVSDFEVRGRRRDAERDWFLSCSGEPVRDENGEQYLSVLVLHDLTAQRSAEIRFRESVELLRTITGSTTDLVFAKDRQGRYLLGNPALFAALRRDESDVIGRTDLEQFGDTLYAREIVEDDRRIMERGQTEVVEEHDTLPDGSTRHWLATKTPYRDGAGHIVGILGIARDITERKRMEESLRTSEERFRALAESMPQIVWIATPEGRVEYWNRRAIEYSGLDTPPGEGAWEAAMPAEDVQRIQDAWGRSRETGEVFSCEHRLKRHDGELRWHLSRAVPMRDEQGRIVDWIGTSTDIEDQKRAEERLEARVRERTAALEASNQELERFAYVASHDLQAPLRTVSNFAQLLARSQGDRLGAESAEFIDFIVEGARRMQRLIDDLLAFSRVGRVEEEVLEIESGAALQTALKGLDAQLRESLGSVRWTSLPRVRARAGQLAQLFQNLVGNALKFRRDELPPVVEISAWRQEDAWVFSVADNGIGIEASSRERIFQAFQRLHTYEERPGSGIGLAICKKIVEGHGGRIWVEARPEGGSDFRFTFADDPAGRRTPTSGTSAGRVDRTAEFSM